MRIAPRLFVFGDVGQIPQPPAVRVSARRRRDDRFAVWHRPRRHRHGARACLVPLGGIRYEAPAYRRVSPYVFGGAGVARVTPSAQFTFASGTLPGATPGAGDDVTQQLTSLGDFTQPAATTAPMFSLGGGVEIPVAHHLSVDAGYRYDRIATDTPLSTRGATFGFGYRF